MVRHFLIGTIASRGAMAALLACGMIVAAGSLSAEETLYASDESGFRGERLASAPEKGWTLGVEPKAGTELRVLRKDGEEKERTLVEFLASGMRESRSVAGKPSSVAEYDRSGALSRELFYSADGGRVEAERRYSYQRGQLVRVEAYDGQGALSGSLSYRYDPSGRLVELLAKGDFGFETTGALPGSPGPGLIWSETGAVNDAEGPAKTFLVVYDQLQRPLVMESRSGDKLARREILAYGKSSLVSSRVVEVPESREKVETSYDEGGRPVLSVTTVDSKESSRESWTYDEKGRLLTHETRTRKELLQVTVEWLEDGGSRESTSRDGKLLTILSILPDGGSVKEYYDKGKLYLRATMASGRLRKEEFISDGKILRTKDYP